MQSADDPNLRDACGRAINHIFESALTLAAVVARPDVTDERRQCLGVAIDQLDCAVTALRRAAFIELAADCERDVARSHRNRRPTSKHAPASRAAIVADPQRSAAVIAASTTEGRRRLSRFGEGEFAYAMRGHDFYRRSDHELWAHESDGLLLSARSGAPLARRDGHVFYDLETNAPLYYEDDHTSAPSSG